MITPDSLAEAALSFQKSRVLLSAYELGIFTVLGKDKKSSSEVANALGTAGRATDRLMNALCAMGLLNKKSGQFANTPPSLKFLVKDSPDYIKGLMHCVHMWDTWSGLTQAVRHGRNASIRAIDERGEEWLSPFIAAMHERACKNAPAVIKLLDLSAVKRVLDVGGGSGVYSMAFARARKEISATVFDLPNVIALTRGYVEAQGLADRVDMVSGDYNVNEFGGGFDLAFLSAIIHINSPEQNETLVGKAARALKPGGQVVIQDFIMNEDRVHPAYGAVFALNMLVATESGDTYTEFELRQWLNESGLVRITRKDTRFGTTLIIGRKES